MFAAHNFIQWMDVEAERVETTHIDDFFRSYIHLAKEYKGDDGCSVQEITFDDRIVKITDMFGWTDIRSIYRVDKHRPLHWNNLRCANKQLIVSDGTIMLTYDPSKISRGFHGEVKYGTIIKSAYNLKEHLDILRVKRGGVDENYNDVEFDPIREIISMEDDWSSGFVIKTRSGRMNVSGVHCFAE